ncbi:MAG: hypothetical protein L3J91_05630 [Thermoplasmata archaeon]|nr:hypothetical protein [Thermoplasmata archaeon]
MVQYRDETLFPRPRDAVWKLLNDHLDDGKIGRIHHLISNQKTMSRDGTTATVERWIDVRGKAMRSIWKITYRPPDSARWDVVESQGPWAPGSYVESTYTEAPGGTTVRTTGELTISVLPFFMSQRSNVRKVFDTIHDEDLAYLGP